MNKVAWKYFYNKNKEGIWMSLIPIFTGGLMFLYVGDMIEIKWLKIMGFIFSLIPLILLLSKCIDWIIKNIKEAKDFAIKQKVEQ